MADLGDSSQANTAHKVKMTSWITVALITLASIVLGFAFVMRSIPLAVVGGVLLVAGGVAAVAGRIMDEVH